MNIPLYQYSKELKCWVWLANIQITGKYFRMFWFPKGSLSYEINLYSVTKIWNINFMKNVKTIQIKLI